MATFTLTPLPRLGITPEGGMLINTYTAGTSTPAATYADSAGSALNTNPVVADGNGLFPAIYLPIGASFKLVCTHAITNALPPDPVSNLGVVIWTQDGVGSVPLSGSTLDVSAVFGETVMAGNVVYMSGGDGGKIASRWYLADSANGYSSTDNEVGFVSANTASGATGSVRESGAVSGLAGLIAGSRYFVGTAGAITLTEPSNARYVGQASSTTTIDSACNPPPLVSSGLNILQIEALLG